MASLVFINRLPLAITGGAIGLGNVFEEMRGVRGRPRSRQLGFPASRKQ
jgi:hypothetical protein